MNRKIDSDYLDEEYNNNYVQSITGSQIVRAYGVSQPIQEAPSIEEYTLRQADSYMSNFARGDNRHQSQAYSNLSNILTKPSTQQQQQLNSLIITSSKKDDKGSAPNTLNKQISLKQPTAHGSILGEDSDASSNNISNIYANQNPNNYQQQFNAYPIGQSSHGQLKSEEDMIDSNCKSQRRIITQSSQQHQQQTGAQLINRDSHEYNTNNIFKHNLEFPSSLEPESTNQTGYKFGGISEQQYQQQIQIQTTQSSTPIDMLCPYCSQNISTLVTFQPNCKTHTFAAGLFVIGFLCGMCFIPYFFPQRFQIAFHSCPTCQKQIAKKEF